MLMIMVFLAAIILAVLLLSEYLWRKNIVRGEAARKLIHMAVGTFAAFWPYFLSWEMIQLMSIALLVVVYASWKLNIFHAVHGIKRKTWGELLFPLSIGMLALIRPEAWMFTAALLHMSLADGLAAIAGTRYGKHQQYKVFGYTKTLIGTFTFWIVSFIILTTVIITQSPEFDEVLMLMIVGGPLVATVLENIAVKGSDNIVVPLFVLWMLNTLSVLS